MTHDDPDARRQEDAQIRSMLAQGMGRTRIALALGWTDNKVRHRIDAIREADGAQTAPRGAEPPPPVAATDEVTRTESQDGITLTVERGQRITTLEALLAATDVDLSVWHVEKWTANTWEVAAKDADGAMVPTTVYQVKAHLKRIPGADLLAGLRDGVLADIRAERRAPAPVLPAPRVDPAARHMLEVSAFDLHIGKLAWGEETGWGDYDSGIASRVFRDAVLELVQKASGFAVTRVLFPVGNDLLQVDSSAGTTTSGTPVDTDSRFVKMFRRARSEMTWAIRLLSEIAPVQVVIVPGNHDRQSAFVLGEVLDAQFDGDERVTVDNRPTQRKYVRWGASLLGFTHGDKIKPERLPMLMAHERPQDWAETTHHEWHRGHRHSAQAIQFKAVETYDGVRVRILPSLCPPDAWHSGEGFVGELRAAEAYLWNFRTGYSGHLSSTVQPEVAADAAKAA